MLVVLSTQGQALPPRQYTTDKRCQEIVTVKMIDIWLEGVLWEMQYIPS